MLRLTKRADYALIAMKHLASVDEGSASARAIAERYRIPSEILAKVLQRLVRCRLLASEHGTKGGYTLGRDPSRISVAEVVEAVDGPITLTTCSESDNDCEQYSACTVRDPLWQIRDRITESLESFSIADLAKGRVAQQRRRVAATCQERGE